jgi:hypothetical protein
MSILDAVTIDLPPTATYARREVFWIPGDEPGEGTLTIRLWKGRRGGSRCDADRYQIQEEACAYPGCRSFLILNETDDTQEDVYRCRVGAMPGCSCKAGLVHRHECKHVAAVAALTEEGLL